MKTRLDIIFAFALFSISLILIGSAAYIIASEVWPAMRNGSLNVETSSVILNQTWNGNDIYILLATYLVLGLVSALSAFRLAIRARGG